MKTLNLRKFGMSRRFGTGVLVAVAPLALLLSDGQAPAADHLDPPARTDAAFDTTPDVPADIADVYTWYTDTSVVIIMTFAGPTAGTQPAFYDRNVLYTINISNAEPTDTSEFKIRVRFGQDTAAGANQYGVKFSGLPGVAGDIVGPVESDLVRDGVKVRAGLFDDPFFFDLQGFRATRDTGTLAFSSSRNFFNGQNDTAIVMEIPRSRLQNGSSRLDIWGQTARFGGNL